VWHIQGEERCIYVWLGNLKEENNLEYLCGDGRIILKLIFQKENWEVLTVINLAQDRSRVWLF